ncbi:MAG TPA: response regulator transcription factor [Cyclobacteriaceae bacterium]|jgi:DNA-binding response OmpR family regulator
MKVLVVEDNLELAHNMESFLKREGHVCETSNTLNEARDKLVSFQYDCIILDLMLPDGNGLELVEFMKQERMESGILIVSAKNALDDRVKGLELGADDYLTKPFHLTELNARLRAIFRRRNLNGERVISLHEININPDTMEAQIHGRQLDLTPKEFELLLYFVINKNRVLTRQSIAEHLWGDYIDNLANVDFVYQHVKNLRKKIDQAQGKDYIETVYGLGYKFNAAK